MLRKWLHLILTHDILIADFLEKAVFLNLRNAEMHLIWITYYYFGFSRQDLVL